MKYMYNPLIINFPPSLYLSPPPPLSSPPSLSSSLPLSPPPSPPPSLSLPLSYAVYKDMSEAVAKHPDADQLISFASLRSAYESTLDALQYPQVLHPFVLLSY